MYFNYFLEVLRKFNVFSGRSSRAEYWYSCLVIFLIQLVLMFLGEIIDFKHLSNIFTILMILPGIALSVRRLHDVNKSGWMLLLGLIPVVGSIWLLVLHARKGDEGDNKYGPKPQDDFKKDVEIKDISNQSSSDNTDRV